MAQEDYRQKYIVEVEVQKGNAEKTLKDLEKEARETGSEIDKALSGGGGEKAADGAKAVSNELGKAADAAKDVTTEVQQIVDAVEDVQAAVGDGLLTGSEGGVNELASSFEDVRNQMTALAEENNATIEGYIRNLESLGDENADVTGSIIDALRNLGGANKDIARETAATIDQFEGIGNRISEVKQAMATMSAAGNEDTEGYKNLSQELLELQEKAVGAEGDLEEMTSQFELLSGALSGSSEELEAINPILETLNKMQEASGDELESLREELVGYIQSLGTKTAAEQASTATTVGLDMAMKALNRTLKANIITAIMSLLVGLVNLLKNGIGELWKWVSGEKAINDISEKYKRTLEDINREYARREKMLKAEGAQEYLIIQNKINLQKENIRLYKEEEGAIVKNGGIWQRMFGLSGKTLDKIAELRKEAKEASKELDELQFDRKVNNASLQRGYDKDAKSRNNSAADDAERLLENKIANEYERLRKNYEYKLKQISRNQTEYMADVMKEWDTAANGGVAPIIDTSGFDKQKANAHEEYLQAVAALNKKYNEELENQKRITDQLNDTNERSKRLDMAGMIGDEVAQLRLLNEAREKQKEAIKKEGEERKKAINESGSYTTEQKKTLNAEVDSQVAASSAAVDQEAENARIKLYQDSAMKLLQIEEETMQRRHTILMNGLDEEVRASYEAELKKINDSEKSEREKLEARKKLQEEYAQKLSGDASNKYENQQTYSNFQKDSIESVLGEQSEEIYNELQSFVDELLNSELDVLTTQVIPQLEEEIRQIAAKGGDVSSLSAKLAIAKQRADQLGKSTDVLNKKNKEESKTTETVSDRWSAAADVFKRTAAVINELTDAFGDYMSESAKEALSFVGSSVSAMGDIVDGIGKAMEISTKTASDSMKAMESASVILAIISAAIQIAMQIAKLIQFYSADAVAERKIEELQKQLDELRHKQKLFQAEMDSKKGTEYWEDMIKMAKSYKDNIEIIEEQISIALEREDAARSKKKKEKWAEELRQYEEALADEVSAQREAWQSLFDEVLQTDLKGFSDQLADDIFSAFDEGCQDMSDTWNKTIDGMLDAALKAQFSRKLQDMLSPVFDQMEKLASDGNLSDEELADIIAAFDSVFSSAEKMAEEVQSIRDKYGFGNYEDVNGSSGAFETMSQDTAEELNGRFTALQMSGAAIAEIADSIRAEVVAMRGNSSAVSDNVSFILGIQQQQLEELERISTYTSNLVGMRQDLQQIKARL